MLEEAAFADLDLNRQRLPFHFAEVPMSQTITLDAGELDYDPAVHPERYEGVRTRRVFAFLVDSAVILVLMVAAYVVIAVVGVFTLGLLWLLLPAVWPVVGDPLFGADPRRAAFGDARHALHGDRDPQRAGRADGLRARAPPRRSASGSPSRS